MTGRQYRISAGSLIPDEATSGAVGVDWTGVLGKTVDLVYEIPDSDRDEVLLRFVNGPVLLVSCDPGFDRERIHRTPEHWETVVYDATETEAGKNVCHLDPGHWL